MAARRVGHRRAVSRRSSETVAEWTAAVDGALSALHQVQVPEKVTSTWHQLPPVPSHAPKFVKEVLGTIIANKGDSLPVSALPCDGTFPTGSTKYEKRSIAQDIPIWDPEVCIQCGRCSLACPHATIRKIGRAHV